MRWKFLLFASAPLAFAAACANPDAERAGNADSHANHSGGSAPSVVTIVATDYAFDAPDTLPAGVTKFVLKGAGQDIHHATIAKLDSGKTVADSWPR